MLEEEFEAHRNLVSIPYGSAERLIRAVGDSDEQQAQRCLEALKPFLFTSLNYEHGLLLQFLLSGMDAQLRECGSSIDRILVEHLHMVNRPGSGLSREKEYLILEDGVRRSAAYLREQRRGHGGQVVHQVQKYIDDHFDEDVNLTALAARFYIDSSQLSREFKKNVGINLNRYIRQTRLHHAAVLLSNTDMRMSDVSRRVGYDNPDYFMKLFREEYNMTPSDYRSLLDGKKIE